MRWRFTSRGPRDETFGRIGYALPLKIDNSDGFRHVALRRSAGWPKHIRFTPDDPEAQALFDEFHANLEERTMFQIRDGTERYD